MREYSEKAQIVMNAVPISFLDKQIMLGNWHAVCINDGQIVGTEDEE